MKTLALLFLKVEEYMKRATVRNYKILLLKYKGMTLRYISKWADLTEEYVEEVVNDHALRREFTGILELAHPELRKKNPDLDQLSKLTGFSKLFVFKNLYWLRLFSKTSVMEE